VGYWGVKNMSVFHAFILVGYKLFGSKTFSILIEDYVSLNPKEEIKSVEVSIHQYNNIKEQPVSKINI
jgi:hypothetical protein